MRSPWARVLGAELERLDPTLRAYFSTIGPAQVGRGAGTFTVVGTRRRWLWPVLAVLALDGIVFPVFEHDVAFTVTNRRGPHGTVRAERVFHFPAGDRTMADETGLTAQGLVDRLGRHGTLEAVLSATVVGGSLHLDSTGVAIRLAGIRIPLGRLSPRVALVESRNGDIQHVSLTVDAPVLGRLYEYAGSFTYEVAES